MISDAFFFYCVKKLTKQNSCVPLFFFSIYFVHSLKQNTPELKRNIKNGNYWAAARCKAWVYGRSLAGVAVSNAAGAMDVCLL
jgi:hypothetical protein